MANEIHKTLKLDVNLLDSIAWIGTVALQSGKANAAEVCREIGGRLKENDTVTLRVPIVLVLCAACDHYRAKSDAAMVELLEDLIKLLKDKPQEIRGTFTFSPKTAADLEVGIEKLRTIFKPGE